MSVTDPRIETRPEQPYLGIRTEVGMGELGSGIIPQLHSDVMRYMKAHNIQPSGAPILIYHIINMPGKMHLEMAWPVATPQKGDDRVVGSSLPAGRYGVVLYTGDYSGLMDANRVLIEWAKSNNIEWDRWDDPAGDAFRARYETYITDPGDEPDSAKWQTEVAIKLADK